MKKRSVALVLTAVIIISLYFAFNKGLFNAFFDVVFLNSSELTQYAVPESGRERDFSDTAMKVSTKPVNRHMLLFCNP